MAKQRTMSNSFVSALFRTEYRYLAAENAQGTDDDEVLIRIHGVDRAVLRSRPTTYSVRISVFCTKLTSLRKPSPRTDSWPIADHRTVQTPEAGLKLMCGDMALTFV